MNVILKIIFVIFVGLFVVGLSNPAVFDNNRSFSTVGKIHKLEEGNKTIPVVDYERIKKAVKNFKFFPISFFVSTDGCNSFAESIEKDTALDMDICIGFNVIDDFHHLRVELITPDDSVYQSQNIFVDREGAPPRMIKFGEDFTPYMVKKPVILKEVSIVSERIPVAGSSIQAQNLVGNWKAYLYIDDSATPYGIISFEIK